MAENCMIPDFNSSDEEKVVKPNNENNNAFNLTGWNELFLKDDLKRAIRECGF